MMLGWRGRKITAEQSIYQDPKNNMPDMFKEQQKVTLIEKE